MKIGKKLIREKIDNPFRKKPPFRRTYTVCRITEKTLISVDPEIYTVQLDCDEVESFTAVIKTIPNPEKYYDSVYEMWFFMEKWLDFLVDNAKKHFEKVHVEKADGTVIK